MGIKDTNDELVALTLRALAELVPLLGSDAVIGGKRAKLFTDGRPVLHTMKNHKQRTIQPHNVESSPVNLANPMPADDSALNIIDSQVLLLPERPQPDGEEVDNSTDEIEQSADDDDDDDDMETWDDWDANENNQSNFDATNSFITTTEPQPDLLKNSSLNSSKYDLHRKKSLPDITELDIKNQTNGGAGGDDVDFFQDMEPIIETKPRFAIVDSNEKLLSDAVKKMSLNVVAVDEVAEDGWGEEEWD